MFGREHVSVLRPANRMRDERGAALILTLILVIGLVTITAGAVILTGTEGQLRTYAKGQINLRYLAEQGAEMGLSRINLDETALPAEGYSVLESGYVPTDAAGHALERVKVNIYAARTGSATGVSGNYASVVGEALGYGTRQIVRLELTEESFAKYAYFTDNEGGNIWFGGGDELFGPVHSNDVIKIHSTGAWFHDDVTTAQYVEFPENGTFDKGYQEGVDYIPMPDASDMSRLEALAAAGHTRFATPTTGSPTGNVEMRIEFLTIDVNGDGDALDDGEGFFRVYRAPDGYTVGGYNDGGGPNGMWRTHCGDWHDHPTTGEPWFISADNHKVLYEESYDEDDYPATDGLLEDWNGVAELLHGVGNSNWGTVYQMSVQQSDSRCLLGGDLRLVLDNRKIDTWDGTAVDAGWLRRDDYMPSAAMPAVVLARPDADALFPLDRDYNPDFRGVFYFEGMIGFSGNLNGRITLVSSDNIVLLDDFTYSVPANAARCNDIAGFIAQNNFYVADNNLNAPQVFPSPPGTWTTYDDTGSEFIDGIILALNTSFTVENWNLGPTDAEACETTPWGRGCLYLTGGLIQEERGPVGRVNGQGYLKRYAYDSNARFCPPPHFPTTGKFVKNRYFQVAPDAFVNRTEFFTDLQ